MEIPQDVQNKLKCSECNELLSCGPVYILHRTGGTICGRCSQEPEGQVLNQNGGRSRLGPYEATASFLTFPCAFAAHGCPEKLPFSLGRPPHELGCKSRPFTCPIAPPAICDWTGPWPKLKQHCDEEHPSNILENPCHPPRPDLTTANSQSYLISTFNFLFLLQFKVCLTSGKMFHSIRMFGDQAFLEKFSFKLEVEGNNMKFAKSGAVLRPGFLTIEEPNVVYTTINCLAQIFGATESKFTLRIKALFKFCANCFNEIENESDSRFCGECNEKLIKCKFHEKECLFVDVCKRKCLKHERFFCKYQTKCKCDVEFAVGTFIEHLESSSSCRKTSKSNIDSAFRLTRNIDNNKKMIIFSSKNFDNVICEYKLSDNCLVLRIFTSLPSFDLRDLKCSIKLTDPVTKHTEMLTPEMFASDNWWDWYIKKDMYDFACWKKHGTDIKINIVQK